MKSGGYASGGAAHGPGCNCARCRGGKAATGGRISGYADGGKIEGEPAPARLDKRQRGGGIHQITPSKRKPHTNINIVNVSGRPRRRGLMPMPPVPPGGPGLPALPAPGPAMPLGRPPGMAKGGGVTKPNKLWGGAPYGGAGSDGLARLTMAKRKPIGKTK